MLSSAFLRAALALLWLTTACRSAEPDDTDYRRARRERVAEPVEETSGQAQEPPSKVGGEADPRENPPAADNAPSAANAALLTPNADERAPDTYAVELVTTEGPVVIDVARAWAPKGADRFYTLVRSGYFTDVAFFRVVEGFMAQAGIHGDPRVNRVWSDKSIQDDPVTQSNTRGMVTFATAGPNTRANQFFINFGDNSRLDAMGFAPFGKVRDMAVVDKLHDGYGEGAPRGRGTIPRRHEPTGKRVPTHGLSRARLHPQRAYRR